MRKKNIYTKKLITIKANIIDPQFARIFGRMPRLTRLLYSFSLFLQSVILVLFLSTASSQHIIKTLPGFDGELPFKLETGYVGIGENDVQQLFYYFTESERDPDNDPLFVSLTGGPGCSALYALVFEYGPIAFDPSTFGQRLPSLVLNPYSWTKMANIIFVDWPVGAGFSYATNPEAYATNDTAAPKDLYAFLRKWLLNHPKFIKNPLYVQGESYGGKIAGMFGMEIIEANEAGILPKMNLQGFFVGNADVNPHSSLNEQVPYSHSMALLTDEYLEAAKISCNGEYANPDNNNVLCLNALKVFNECIEGVDQYHILEPSCPNNTDAMRWDETILEDSPNHISLPSSKPDFPCRGMWYHISEHWTNNPIVREALHVRKGTKGEWIRCNRTKLAYDRDIPNTAEYYLNMIKKGYRGLIYSGDHDMIVPYTGTIKWIRSFNLTVVEDWRPWKANGKLAGFTMKFKDYGTHLIFATVKDSGHTVAEYTPEPSFALISRWFSRHPL